MSRDVESNSTQRSAAFVEKCIQLNYGVIPYVPAAALILPLLV